MDKYPPELLSDPKPLVYITGTIEGIPDFQIHLKSIIEAFSQSTDGKDVQSLDIRFAHADHDFPVKKPTKECPTFDGLFRSNWIQKHHDFIPSVVIVLMTVSADWSQQEWIKREGTLNERFARLRSSVSSRDGKIILFAVRTDNTTSQLERETLDEHIVYLKRHLQLDSKSFMTFSQAEVNTNNAMMKRFYKILRESSTGYYNTQSRKAKNQEKAVGIHPGFEHLLNARCSFKVSFFFEFLGQKHQSLKYYIRCFRELVQASEAASLNYTDQIKYLADYANLKVCNMYLREGQVKEAFQQFKAHIGCFSKVYSEMPWRHYAWVSDQYIVFAQLLEKHNISEPIPENDRSYLFQNAARYAAKRQSAFSHIKNASVGGQSVKDQIEVQFKGMIIVDPKYLGALPQLVDPVLDQVPDGNADNARTLMKSYLEEQETTVDHAAVILALLQQAHERIDPAHKRRRALFQERVADFHIQEGQFTLALRFLSPAAELLVSEGWISIAIPILRKKMSCAVYLGHLKEYLLTALTLYTIGVTEHLTMYEQEELHKDIFAVIRSVGLESCDAQAIEQISGHVPASFSSSNKSALDGRVAALQSLGLADSQFGMFAPAELTPEHSLPNYFVTEMNDGASLFNVEVTYPSNSVELGQSVKIKVAITSLFFEEITFGEMSLHFTNRYFVKKFVHVADSSSSSSSSESESASLVFPAKKTVIFEFDLKIPESSLDPHPRDSTEKGDKDRDSGKEKDRKKKSQADSMVALERIELHLKFPSATANMPPPPPDSSFSGRQFIFNVSTFSKAFKRARDSYGKTFDLRELIRFVGRKDSAPVFQIVRPTAAISMLSPKEVSLLQGPIQRINLVFKVEDSSLLNGKLHLSSEYLPNDSSGALFWYPDVKASSFEALSSSETDVDAVVFHPLTLNDSMQPARSLQLPEKINGSHFYVPLFVRSDQLGTIKMKAMLEFTPKKDITVSMNKEFDIKLSFKKAMELRYTLTSFKDAQCGVQRDGGHTVALRGDVINVAASLRCLDALGASVRLIGMFMQTSDLPIDPRDPASHAGNESFRVYGMGGDYNVLMESGDEAVDLTKDEVYVGNVDVECLPNAASAPTSKPCIASMGNMFITWKVIDPMFLQPLDVDSYVASKGDQGASLVQINVEDGSIHQSEGDMFTDSEAFVEDLTWLPPLNDSKQEDASMLDKTMEFTRTCAMLFAVPSVMLMDAPFDVKVEAPTSCVVGEEVYMTVRIQSNLASSERMRLQMTIPKTMVVTGKMATSLDIAPHGTHIVSTAMIPLQCGSTHLPHIRIIWDRINTAVIDMSPQGSGRTLYVHPSGME